MGKILILSFSMFALGLDAYVMAGLLPFIGQSFHISIASVGQTVSVFTVCYAISAPIFATIIAGKPIRTILVIALGVFSCANIWSAVSGSLFYLLLSRVVAGVGAGIFSPVAVYAASQLVNPQKKGQALSFILGGMSIGTVFGVPAGLFIANHMGWRVVMWIIALLGALGMLGIILYLPIIRAVAPPSLKSRIMMIADTKVANSILVTFLTSIASLGLYTYITQIVVHDNLVLSPMKYMWAWGIGGCFGSLTIGFLIDKLKNSKLLMVIILLLMFCSFIILHSSLNFGIFAFIPFLIWGATGWSSQAPQQHTLLSLQPEHGSAVIALNSSANYLGGAVGAFLGGIVMIYTGSAIYLPYLASGVILIALLLQLRLLYQDYN